MKRYLCVGLLLALGGSWLVWPGDASAKKSTKLNVKAGTNDVLSAVVITFDVAGNTNCSVLLTGTTSFGTGTNFLIGATNIISSEIVAMDLAGQLADGSPVKLLAGNSLVGVPSLGVLVSTNGLFPADSSYDLIAEVQLPGGTNLITTTPIHIATTLTNYPPVHEIYTNATQAALADVANPTNVVGQFDNFALLPAGTAKEIQVGFSANVTGTNGLGTVTTSICPTGGTASATVTLKLTDLSGTLQANPGCDDVLSSSNVLFSAKLTKTLRLPDWRGSHTGNWIMYTLLDRGQTNLVAFGTMSGSNGVGTHRPPVTLTGGENCAECSHFEGSLQGTVIDKTIMPGTALAGSYAGQFVDDLGAPLDCCVGQAGPPNGPVVLTIDGVLTTKCTSVP